MMMLVLLALFFFFKSRRRAGATEEERREEGESDESKKCFSTLSETPLSLSLSIPPSAARVPPSFILLISHVF